METESELSRRLNQVLSGTIHEQLRTLVHDAREGIEQFSDVAERQGEAVAEQITESHQKLDDALASTRAEFASELRSALDTLSAAREADRRAVDETIVDLRARLDQVGAGVNESLEIVRGDIESFAVQSERRATEELTQARADAEVKIGAVADQLEAEADRLSSEIATRIEAVVAKLDSFDEAERRIDDRQGSFEIRIQAMEQAVERLRLLFEEHAAASAAHWHQVAAKLEDTSGIEERAAQRLVELLSKMFAAAEARKEELSVVTDELRTSLPA